MQVVFETDKPERVQLLLWLKYEWEYADNKFKDQRPQHDLEMTTDGVSVDSWWYNQFIQYIGRVRVFGLELPQGRQALAKCFAAMSGCIESAMRVYGDLPAPGYSSGNINEVWGSQVDQQPNQE